MDEEVKVAVPEVCEAENKLLLPKLQYAGQLAVTVPEVGGVGVELKVSGFFHLGNTSVRISYNQSLNINPKPANSVLPTEKKADRGLLLIEGFVHLALYENK